MDKKDLLTMPEEKLNELYEEGKISLSEWLEAQPEKYDGYADWLIRNNKNRDDVSARQFINQVEDGYM